MAMSWKPYSHQGLYFCAPAQQERTCSVEHGLFYNGGVRLTCEDSAIARGSEKPGIARCGDSRPCTVLSRNHYGLTD